MPRYMLAVRYSHAVSISTYAVKCTGTSAMLAAVKLLYMLGRVLHACSCQYHTKLVDTSGNKSSLHQDTTRATMPSSYLPATCPTHWPNKGCWTPTQKHFRQHSTAGQPAHWCLVCWSRRAVFNVGYTTRHIQRSQHKTPSYVSHARY
jgi:hypothetical protein